MDSRAVASGQNDQNGDPNVICGSDMANAENGESNDNPPLFSLNFNSTSSRSSSSSNNYTSNNNGNVNRTSSNSPGTCFLTQGSSSTSSIGNWRYFIIIIIF